MIQQRGSEPDWNCEFSRVLHIQLRLEMLEVVSQNQPQERRGHLEEADRSVVPLDSGENFSGW